MSRRNVEISVPIIGQQRPKPQQVEIPQQVFYRDGLNAMPSTTVTNIAGPNGIQQQVITIIGGLTKVEQVAAMLLAGSVGSGPGKEFTVTGALDAAEELLKEAAERREAELAELQMQIEQQQNNLPDTLAQPTSDIAN